MHLPDADPLCDHGCTMRFVLYLRMIFEGVAGVFILLILPFTAIDLLHSGAPTKVVLIGWLMISVLFLLGILLFRDAVVLRMRLKAHATE